MDAPTISAFAAGGAAIVAATVAGIQLYVGRRQSDAALTSAKATLMSAQNAGRHTIAEFRQKWIDNVIDTLCEHHSIVMTRPPGSAPSPEEHKKLSASRTKLAILLNPDEPDTVALLKSVDEIDDSETAEQRDAKAGQMLIVARRLLKKEWVRIKNELQ